MMSKMMVDVAWGRRNKGKKTKVETGAENGQSTKPFLRTNPVAQPDAPSLG